MKLMFHGQSVFGPRGPAGPDGNPIGTVISYMGVAAPDDYLVCDGTVYDISKYSKLASFFQEQFGSSNYFGGDGITTFAVPDMRNLFLRGYHGEAEDQLSGEVGEKQEATQHPEVWQSAGSVSSVIGAKTENPDKSFGEYTKTYYYANATQGTATSARNPLYSSRPVNMAVLYCIKAVESKSDSDIYSVDERVIGTWVDGKPLYRICIPFDVTTSESRVLLDPGNLNLSLLDEVISQSGSVVAIRVSGGNDDGLISIGTPAISVTIINGVLYFDQKYSQSVYNYRGYLIFEYTKTTDMAG